MRKSQVAKRILNATVSMTIEESTNMRIVVSETPNTTRWIQIEGMLGMLA